MKKLTRRRLEESIALGFMYISLGLVTGALGWILLTLIIKGAPALTWSMVSQVPQGGFYLGKEGGILNAIIGSLYLALGGTMLALLFSLPISLGLNVYIHRKAKWALIVRSILDVLWGIPSIVYGAFGFTIMLALGMRASLLAGIITLALVELPIMIRSMDEVLRLMPRDIEHASYGLGATRIETAFRVILPQMLPGLVTAAMLAFGRGIGDAASVLFTAGYTDRIPTSLMDPTASLPLAVFFQLSMPYPEVQKRAYGAALILTIIVLLISILSRWIASRVSRYSVK
ncbi:MAG: phosphate ABC transporter, permease protein PstA [Anaerolinea sp.]|nr:phosphate ABC transporter, permease protein PstA [Anaerolinea sp.]